MYVVKAYGEAEVKIHSFLTSAIGGGDHSFIEDIMLS